MNIKRHITLAYAFCAGLSLAAQPASKQATLEGRDYTESTSYNEAQRGTARRLQYYPEGEDFVCVNGKNRYTRALYGGPTAWRLETSDRPIFATYEKNNSRNIRFVLRLTDGTRMPLDSTSWCEAHYIPGRRDYQLKDPSWGADSRLTIETLADRDAEAALWRISGQLPEGCKLETIVSDIRIKKLSRNGDMGSDPTGC